MLDEQAIGEFASTLRGEVIQPTQDSYDERRVVWNGAIDRKPRLIVRCFGVADVMDVTRFAQNHNLPLSVCGGGHNVAGHGICDDGLMLDMSLMRGTRVDPKARRVQVQGGATWGDVDRETQRFGLATPGGLVSTTGVAGLTLCGGIGYLRRKHGLSCDNLESVDLVTAKGEFVTASETENQDLFWALRGGGGNFGVVTSFTFQLHPLGPEVMFLATMYPVEDAQTLITQWRDFMTDAPNELSSQAMFWSVPNSSPFPKEAQGKPVLLIVGLYAGNAREGETVVQPLRELASPLVDLSGPAPYAHVQSSFDYLFPKGKLHHYWKSLYLSELSSEVIGAVTARGLHRPTARSFVNLWHMGGAMSARGPADSAFGDRSSPYLLEISTTWEDVHDSRPHTEWTRNFWSSMQKHSNGKVYLNWPGSDSEGDQQVATAYGDNYPRLTQVKRRYDPGNVFRHNQNIPPASKIAAVP